MGRLDGRVAFITGAARGQGRAHAIRLAREGADIIAVDICGPVPHVTYAAATPADLAETVRLVEAEDRRIVARQADVRDLDQVQAAVDTGVAELGRLDIVVANAGVCYPGRAWEITPDEWQTTIDINLTGCFYTLKATVPTLIRQGEGGSIIITSSVAGLRGLPFLAQYAAAKHGVVGLAKTFANELGEYDIRVNTVHPNGVNTPMGTDTGMADLLASKAETLGPIFMNTLPYQIVEPEDIANTVAFLASDEAKYITGSQFPVDLGTLIR